MLKRRVIPTLLFKDNVLVKGKNFLSNRPVVSAIESVKTYDLREVDELIFNDILASTKNNEPDYNMISEISKECFVPLVVGGGIKNLKIIENLLRNGADKVSINTWGVKDPDLLKQASKEFGSQCIVGSLDYKKSKNNKVFTICGTQIENYDIFEMAEVFEQNGCGELIITSIDNDGNLCGYDVDILQKIKKKIKIPLIASGGCGSYDHMLEVFKDANVDAVAAASIFHFSKMTPREAKKYLFSKGINVRN